MTVDTKYFSVQDAAQTLSVDDEQILDLIHSGSIKAVNVAKHGSQRPRWRISEGDLGRFLLSRLHPASTPSQSKPQGQKRTKPLKQHV